MTVKAKLKWLEQCGYGPRIMKRTKVCPTCGRMVSESYVACPDCGMKLLNKTLYDRYRERHLCCDRCSTVLASDSRYCPRCGRSLYLKSAECK